MRFLLTFILSGVCLFHYLGAQSLENIPQLISQLPHQSTLIRFKTKGFNIPHKGGHYQGIQAFSQDGKNYALLSGSSSDRAYQIVVELKQKSTVKELFIFDKEPFRHAGGIQIHEDLLAVGIEDNIQRTISKVQLYQLNNSIMNPAKKHEIVREGPYEVSTAGAVGITKIKDSYLLVVGSWDCQTLDFYESNKFPIDNQNWKFSLQSQWEREQADRSDWSDKDFASYQNLNLITDKEGNIFMLGFAQTTQAEVIDIYEVIPPQEVNSNYRIKKILRKEISLRKTSFKAGGGIYISNDGKLNIYACHHHRPIIEIVK